MYKVAHITANAVLLPYVMVFNRESCIEKYARVAELMGEDVAGLSAEEASQRAVEAVRKLTKELQIPQHVSGFGIKGESIDDIAKACLESQGRLLVLNVREAGIEEVRQILKKAF
jgi:alcohol dehydrogenase class IV